ncbi:MAG: hypothetical protein WC492_02015 [Candidatus Micrarchaeia archaeon]
MLTLFSLNNRSLKKAVKCEKNPFTLSRILNENNIARIGVHPFFYSDLGERGLFSLTKSITYEKYLDFIIPLFSHRFDFEKSLFIFENTVYSCKTAQMIFDSHSANFSQTLPNYFSINGKIFAYGPNVSIISSCAEERACIQKNRASKSFDSLVSLLEKSSGVFVFGMFAEDCVAKAIIDIRKILAKIGKHTCVLHNHATTKYMHEF